MASSWTIQAQIHLEGRVRDSTNSDLLSGAEIWKDDKTLLGLSDPLGRFSLNLNTIPSQIRIHLLGYEDKILQLNIDHIKGPLEILLTRKFNGSNEILVRSTRAQAKDGTVFTNLEKKDLEKNNLGQDLPFLIENTPSLVATSEAGAGVGYTGVRIRGSDATRINVTINGIPYNDSESLGTYFVDIPDIASSLSSIQIQRGIGTSTNGAGSFGGSLNLETSDFQAKSFINIQNSYGSYNTLKNSLNLGTGLLADHWNFSLRLSRISSDGYIERASSNLKSFFFSAGYFGKKDLVKVNIFSGQEKTYQVFLGVPEDSLAHHRRFNPFSYPNQTDNYNQDHFQLFYTHILDTNLRINLAFHLTHGKGYYEEYEANQAFSDYSLPNLSLQGLTIDSTNLIRRQWLDNYFYGLTYSLLYQKPKKHYQLNFGGAYNQYKGLHFGEIIWAEYGVHIPIDYRYYSFNGFKTDFNSYIKYSQEFGSLKTSVDLQYRRVFYQFLGFDENKNNTTQIAILNFFNPKLGLNYSLNSFQDLYMSLGIGHKEANQTDYSSSTPSSRPSPELLRDLEMGYKYHDSNFQVGLNFYWMNYRDQLVLTGQINDVGAYINTNVPRSSRTGLELEGNWAINSFLNLLGNFTWSKNKIHNFHEYISDDQNNQFLIIHPNPDIAYSPNKIGSLILDFHPKKDFHISFISKYVGKQYLDNTQNEARKIDSYFVENIKFQYTLQTHSIKHIDFSLALNNILSRLYVSDGYTSPGIIQGVTYNNNYFYPQAPFNVLGGINFHF